MTAHREFSAFCDAMMGTWTGERTRPQVGVDEVQAVWERALDGAFLEESWYTSEGAGPLRPRARALFKVSGGVPGEFLVAYSGGRIALGESAFDAGRWVLSHGWLGAEPDARITVRLVGEDRYEQEVHARDPAGELTLESRAILVRRR